MKFFDWVILIDCVSVVVIAGLIFALALSWRAEQSFPESGPVIRDLTHAFGRGIFGHLPRSGRRMVLSTQQRLGRFSHSLRTRIGGTVADTDSGRTVSGLSDVVAAE